MKSRHHWTLPALLLTAVAVGGLSVAWAMGSPLGASPDEPTHIAHAYGVATGQTRPGNELLVVDENDVVLTLVTAPRALLEYQTLDCYLLEQAQTPSCGFVSEATTEEAVTIPSYMTRYPPLYYLGAGLVLRVALAAGASGQDAMLAARIASGAASLAMVALAAVTLRRRFSGPGPGLMLLIGLTPVSLSLFSAVNPNGVEIAAAVLSAAFVVALRHDVARHGRPSAPVLLGLIAALVALTWTRPLGLVWTGLLFAIAVLPGGLRPRRPHRLELAVVVLGVLNLLAAVGWFVYAAQTRTIRDEDVETSWSDLSLPVKAVMVALKFGGLLQQMIGLVGSDTPLPLLVVLLWCLVAAVTIAVLAIGSGRTSTGLRHVVAFTVGSIAAVGGYSMLTAFGWQGRYWLPAVAAALVLTVPSLRGRHLAARTIRRMTVGVGAFFVTMQVVGFLWHLWRYVYGVDTTYYRFDAIPRPLPTVGWLPPIGQPASFALLFLGTACLALLLLGTPPAGRGVRRAITDPTSHDNGSAAGVSDAAPCSSGEHGLRSDRPPSGPVTDRLDTPGP